MKTQPNLKGDSEGLKLFWALEPNQAAALLNCRPCGLSRKEAAERLMSYGPNSLKEPSSLGGVILFLSQFKSPITLLLIIAAVLSAVLGDLSDTIIILSIVLISSVLGFIQEMGASNAVTALLKAVQLKCRLIRDGVEMDLGFKEVVPGDLVILSAGDIVPADGLLVSAESLFLDEAAFTGESFPVEKSVGAVDADSGIAHRTNTVYMGSSVVSGRATALIVTTGRHTAFGKISDALASRIPETSFEQGIRKFGYLLLEITLLLVIVIFAINVILHKPVLDSFLFSLALAVGLTPQLLPAIITVNLSVGARRMAERQVIVKRLSAIENIGSMDVLCSDKTGTITMGKVMVKDALSPIGDPSPKVMQLAYLNASLQQGFSNPIDQAIVSHYSADAETATFSLKSEVPYDFIRKRLSVQVSSPLRTFAVTKGALKLIISICTMVEINDKVEPILPHVSAILALYSSLSEQGLRTIGVAYKDTAPGVVFVRADEQDMVFAGFITLSDPPKDGVRDTIAKLEGMGVSLKIITGDNLLVAKHLAADIGVDLERGILTGGEMHNLSSTALRQRAPHIQLFAEVEPSQKERIILALKKSGHVVGFLGDGINDGPALHAADVGISVDTAVDVAKQAADIVLLKADLEVICEGIREGRKTFVNTMKYIFMATSANFGNMVSMAGASLFLSFLPLLPKQILLTNLLTDFPEMAIATDRVDEQTLTKPQKWDLSFIKRFMLLFGLLSSVFDFLTFGILITVLQANAPAFRTAWFTESVISAVLVVLIVRSRLPMGKSIPGNYLLLATFVIIILVLLLPYSPLAPWFGFEPLRSRFYFFIFLVVVGYVCSAEALKRFFFRNIGGRKKG